MTYNACDFELENDRWLLRATRFEGLIGDEMRTHFLLDYDGLPHYMTELLQRIMDRENASGAHLPWGSKIRGGFDEPA